MSQPLYQAKYMPGIEAKKIQIFLHSMPLTGTISYYRLPDGRMVYRPASDEGVIDLEPLRPLIGHAVEIWRDGGLEHECTLTGIGTVDGVPALVFQPEFEM